MADAIIGAWDAKYRYLFWRPITAIQSLADDGYASTEPDPSWTPLLTTSAHPGYPSGHVTLAGAAAHVLGATFGDDAAFDMSSETMPGTLRSFVGFANAVEEESNGRVRRIDFSHFVSFECRAWRRRRQVRAAACDASVARRLGRRRRRQ
jgi:hypothetical protein